MPDVKLTKGANKLLERMCAGCELVDRRCGSSNHQNYELTHKRDMMRPPRVETPEPIYGLVAHVRDATVKQLIDARYVEVSDEMILTYSYCTYPLFVTAAGRAAAASLLNALKELT